jgi:bis(5'-nucleosidyl)-tetraphosphatase
MKEEHSFGVVPLKQEKNEWKLLLIFHRGGKHWGFPKGHKNPNESDIETAARELKEETGLDVVTFISESPYVEKYTFYKFQEKVSKTVSYFPALVAGDLSLQPEEILDARWLSFDTAIKHLTFEEAKAICRKVQKLLKENSTCS